MAELEKLDLVNLGLSLLPDQWRRSPNVQGICKSYYTQLQEIEDVLHQLNDERSVYTASGTQLDVIGLLVKESRVGRSDDEYREAILQRIANNRASGTAPDIKRVAKITTSAPEARLFEFFPGATYIYVNRVASYSSAKAIQSAHVAGVRTRILWHEDGEGVFTAGYGGGVFLNTPIVTDEGDPVLVDTEEGQFELVTGQTSLAPGGVNTLTSIVPGTTEFETVDNRGVLASVAPNKIFEIETGYIIDEEGNYIVDSNGDNIRYVNF